MPAAAVIPAPIAYIKVVAVKKLVVEPWVRCTWSAFGQTVSPSLFAGDSSRKIRGNRRLL